jgi:hypothetical protein
VQIFYINYKERDKVKKYQITNAENDFIKSFDSITEVLSFLYKEQWGVKMTGLLLDGYETAGFVLQQIESVRPRSIKDELIELSRSPRYSVGAR